MENQSMPSEQPGTGRPGEDLADVVDELNRRKVLRTTTLYAVVAWCLLQLSMLYFPNWGLPSWTLTLALTLVVLGFPAVVALAWVFDITAEGIRRTGPGAPPAISRPGGSRVVDLLVILLLLGTLSLLFWNSGYN
jgi:hypothetical protein